MSLNQENRENGKRRLEQAVINVMNGWDYSGVSAPNLPSDDEMARQVVDAVLKELKVGIARLLDNP